LKSESIDIQGSLKKIATILVSIQNFRVETGPKQVLQWFLHVVIESIDIQARVSDSELMYLYQPPAMWSARVELPGTVVVATCQRQ
jgi:hypothetical protein